MSQPLLYQKHLLQSLKLAAAAKLEVNNKKLLPPQLATPLIESNLQFFQITPMTCEK